MLLPAPLPADDSHPVAADDLECHIAERPELGARGRRLAAQHQIERSALERILLVGVVDKPKRDVVELDQRGRRRRLDACPAHAAQSRKTILSSWDLNMA